MCTIQSFYVIHMCECERELNSCEIDGYGYKVPIYYLSMNMKMKYVGLVFFFIDDFS